MNLQFTGGHESDSFWECCRPPTSMAYRIEHWRDDYHIDDVFQAVGIALPPNIREAEAAAPIH